MRKKTQKTSSIAHLEKQVRGDDVSTKRPKLDEQATLQAEADAYETKKKLKSFGNKLEKVEKGQVDVDFELVVPSEPYFHIVRTLLN